MKFSIKDFFSKCDQIRSFLRIWSHLLKKSLMENFIFCAVMVCIWIVLTQVFTESKLVLKPLREGPEVPFVSSLNSLVTR